MKEGILQVYSTEESILLDPSLNLLKAFHAKFVFLDRLVEFLKVKNRSELGRTTGFGYSKVGGNKLTFNRGNRSNRFLSQKVRSFLL